jgi:hypothetical protein
VPFLDQGSDLRHTKIDNPGETVDNGSTIRLLMVNRSAYEKG